MKGRVDSKGEDWRLKRNEIIRVKKLKIGENDESERSMDMMKGIDRGEVIIGVKDDKEEGIKGREEKIIEIGELGKENIVEERLEKIVKMEDEERGGEEEIKNGFDMIVMKEREMIDEVKMIGEGRIMKGGRIGIKRIVDERIKVGVKEDLKEVIMREFNSWGKVL